MKQKLFKALSFLMVLMLLTQIAFAAGDPNIDGGGGGMGQGNRNNGWAISGQGGRLIFNAEGFRVYLANPSTGVPVSSSIDITNSNVARTGIRNGQGKTKHEYKYVDDSVNITTTYNYVLVNTSRPLPRIIPWNQSNNTARIDAIKDWFTTGNFADWVLAQLGTDIDEVRAAGYLLAIEPIAYFRYNGLNYAMTATEVALTNRLTGGSLRNIMGALTHQNLPLSLFLETDEFAGSSFQINAWTGSRTGRMNDSDIINQLGIGYIRYSPTLIETDPGSATFSYPTDTWVVTSFRLCNVRRLGGRWVDAPAITLSNPASARIAIDGTTYNISNIYIPAGGEQLIWVKWKTPSTPQTLTATVRPSTGYLLNTQNTGVSNRYVSSVTATITIFDNNMEREPPDPTLEDTMDSIGYSATGANRARDGTLAGNIISSNTWQVWDCNLQVEFDEDGEPHYYFVFNRIIYTAEARNSYIRLTPDTHNPTAYTRNHRTFMKSGYGVNLEAETFITITTFHEGTRASATVNHFSPTATGFAAAPQYVFAFFREFEYGGYERQLEFVNNRFVFRQNRYSTYNSRVHYTPWWMPDGTNYDILTRSDFAYTPAGRLRVLGVSNPIVIEGNVYDDWRVVKSR